MEVVEKRQAETRQTFGLELNAKETVAHRSGFYNKV
jgi:hypothetical protein